MLRDSTACLNLAQFLPSFALWLKSWLTRLQISGDLREEVVRDCINIGAKKWRELKVLQDVVDVTR
jgi:hypothetical protein